MLIHKNHRLVNEETNGEYRFFEEIRAHIALLPSKGPDRTSAQQKQGGRVLYVYRHTM
jgi:hypothetical protein